MKSIKIITLSLLLTLIYVATCFSQTIPTLNCEDTKTFESRQYKSEKINDICVYFEQLENTTDAQKETMSEVRQVLKKKTLKLVNLKVTPEVKKVITNTCIYVFFDDNLQRYNPPYAKQGFLCITAEDYLKIQKQQPDVLIHEFGHSLLSGLDQAQSDKITNLYNSKVKCVTNSANIITNKTGEIYNLYNTDNAVKSICDVIINQSRSIDANNELNPGKSLKPTIKLIETNIGLLKQQNLSNEVAKGNIEEIEPQLENIKTCMYFTDLSVTERDGVIKDDVGIPYAMQNQWEYFCEITEAYFGNNDWYPHTREELKTYDLLGYNLVRLIWQGLENPNEIEYKSVNLGGNTWMTENLEGTDICPNGWRMPTSNDILALKSSNKGTNELQTLLNLNRNSLNHGYLILEDYKLYYRDLVHVLDGRFYWTVKNNYGSRRCVQE